MTTTETAPVDTTTTVADVCAGLRLWATYWSDGHEPLGRTPDKDIAKHLGITFKRRSADYVTNRYDRADDRFFPGDGSDPAAAVDLANLTKATRAINGHGTKALKLFGDALKKMGIAPPVKYQADVYELAWKTEVSSRDLYTWGWDGRDESIASTYLAWRVPENKKIQVARVKDDPTRAAETATPRTHTSFEQAVRDTIAEYTAEAEATRAAEAGAEATWAAAARATAAEATMRRGGTITVNTNPAIPAGSLVSASEASANDGVRRWTTIGLTS